MSAWPEPDSAIAAWARFIADHPVWAAAIGVTGIALLILERALAISETPDPQKTSSTDDGDEEEE